MKNDPSPLVHPVHKTMDIGSLLIVVPILNSVPLKIHES